jgi:hypothetical protein
MGKKDATSSKGISIILYAVLIVMVVAVVGIAFESKESKEVMYTAQDAALAGAQEGFRYLSEVEVKSEAGLITAINQIVEANGIPDSDGKSANEKNDNVAAFYTAENGARISGCNEVGRCGEVPAAAEGIEVVVVNALEPMAAKVLGINSSLGIAADAIASS